jgi:TRAP-type C4-dicarboxylate transport system substrate-binding protein
MKLRVSLAAVLLAALTAPAAAQVELKFGHVGEPGSLIAASADEFARIANAKLAGKAKVVVFGSSQLGNDRELLQKVKLGHPSTSPRTSTPRSRMIGWHSSLLTP